MSERPPTFSSTNSATLSNSAARFPDVSMADLSISDVEGRVRESDSFCALILEMRPRSGGGSKETNSSADAFRAGEISRFFGIAESGIPIARITPISLCANRFLSTGGDYNYTGGQRGHGIEA